MASTFFTWLRSPAARDYFFTWRVQPRNYLLFACHFTNATAQTIQDARFYNYWYNGGREKKLALKESADPSSGAPGPVTEAVIAAQQAKKAADN
ncbi:hypothetical protein H0H92_007217 [Tricholoma furcatifolium]|nr:hypothetical protein H0H92_007217 [Tricholoma furcatifolium]